MDTTGTISIQKAEESRISEVDFNNIIFGRHFSDHMFVTDFEGGEWRSPRIEPYRKLEMSPSAAVLHYGQSIFEGLKAYKNEKGEILLFRPKDNFKRLNKSAVRMCMPELPEELFMEGLKELVQLDRDWVPEQEGSSLYIRPFMYASDEYLGVKASENYRFIIFTAPVGRYYNEPVKVLIENNFTRAVPGGIGYVKAGGNYGRSLFPAKVAQEKGYHQLIWTDAFEHKYVEESGTMNLMFVIDNTLITPPVSTTILDGVTRNSVLTIARDLGINVEERRISVDEIVEAHDKGVLQDAFGTGTAATIAHISTIGVHGRDLELPSVEERKISNRIAKELQDIRLGRKDDNHGWVEKL